MSSAELSGMLYDGPMNLNQTIILKIGMTNCLTIILKFFERMPLTAGPASLEKAFRAGRAMHETFAARELFLMMRAFG
ncbi:hypothetical protein [Burkholderia stagnalis]|uniref:hypothetical protein n=1 Tax=Burkholderia stagnalis TaxID=1503054 RepID=UPI000A9EEDC0|nr:hypothetical protein [Burkholderia stagnalis]